MVFILKEVKETIFDILQGTIRVLWLYFAFYSINIKSDSINSLNVKLLNVQLNKLKSTIKTATE